MVHFREERLVLDSLSQPAHAMVSEQGNPGAGAQTQKERLSGLDALRFFAAFLVMFYHLAYLPRHLPMDRAASTDFGYPDYPGSQAVAGGWVGVQIFFVISGFVIAYSANHSKPLAFMRSRFLRLAPTLLVCATLSFVVLVATGRLPLASAFHRLLNSWVLWPPGPWVDGSYWTLVVEVAFYAAIFLLLAFNKFGKIGAAAILVGALSSAINIAALITPQAMGLESLPLIRHMSDFALGVLLWLVVFGAGGLVRYLAIGLCLLGAAAEIVLAGVPLHNSGVAALAIWLASLAVLVIALLFRRTLDAWPLRTVGLATYPIYLLHAAIGHEMIRRLFGLGIDRWLALFATVSLIILVSVIFVRWGELPLRRRMSALFDGVVLRVAALLPAKARGAS
jgi:peptidoglycan/LPS O-acetylase OafA/YrhL